MRALEMSWNCRTRRTLRAEGHIMHGNFLWADVDPPVQWEQTRQGSLETEWTPVVRACVEGIEGKTTAQRFRAWGPCGGNLGEPRRTPWKEEWAQGICETRVWTLVNVPSQQATGRRQQEGTEPLLLPAPSQSRLQPWLSVLISWD